MVTRGFFLLIFAIATKKLQLNQNISKIDWLPFQYWSQEKQPYDVKKVTDKWNSLLKSLGIRTIKVFDKNMAYKYINENCPELLISFKTAFHYAVEADIFRAVFAKYNNCIWLDSDIYPTIYTKNILKID